MIGVARASCWICKKVLSGPPPATLRSAKITSIPPFAKLFTASETESTDLSVNPAPSRSAENQL